MAALEQLHRLRAYPNGLDAGAERVPDPEGLSRASGNKGAEALVQLLRSRLQLAAGGRDLVILLHRLVYERPDGSRRAVVSTLREWGEPDGETAMARTVGLPMALAVERILEGQLDLVGARIPTEPAIYDPILDGLEAEGIRLDERWTDMDSE